MNDAMFHLRDSPSQKLTERTRRSKIECGKFAPEGDQV
jgi:hypothetical protein